jgi:hypothetical protein
MVTVIADKEELITPVNNGVNAGSNDNERPFQYIKDYQEVISHILLYMKKIILFKVDFHRSPSCKPLPEDLFGIADDQQAKSSVSEIIRFYTKTVLQITQTLPICLQYYTNQPVRQRLLNRFHCAKP